MIEEYEEAVRRICNVRVNLEGGVHVLSGRTDRRSANEE